MKTNDNKDDKRIEKKKSLSKKLGYIVSLASIGIKIPQLLKLFLNKSVQGLNISLYCIETITQSIAILYSKYKQFPLSSYGENVSLGISNLFILLAFIFYSKDKGHILLSKLSLVSPLVLSLLLKSPKWLIYLQSLQIPLYLFSRLPQIIQTYYEKSSGQLSILTFGGCMIGSIIRIFTTIKEMDSDLIMLLAFFISIILNATVVIQIIYYTYFYNKRIKR